VRGEVRKRRPGTYENTSVSDNEKNIDHIGWRGNIILYTWKEAPQTFSISAAQL
jgi:hypothetical protein